MSSNIVEKGLDYYAIYKLVGLCFCGFLLVIICSYLTYKNYDLIKWQNVDAKIIQGSCERYNNIENNRTVIRYKCNLDIEFSYNNTIINTKYNNDISYKAYSIGDTIKLKCNPKNPSEVMDDTDSYIVYGVGTVIGCIMWCIGCYGAMYCMKNNCAVLGGIIATTDVIQSFTKH